MMPMDLGPLVVRVRPWARKSTCQGPVRATRTDRAPAVRVACSSSYAVCGVNSSVVSSKSGPRGGSPSKWVRVTPMTSGIGAWATIVTTGPFSRSPRWRTGRVGAWISRAPASVAVTSRAWTGWAAVTPSRSSQ
jgi:hypothetical protein